MDDRVNQEEQKEHENELDIDILMEIFRTQGMNEFYIKMLIDYCDQDKNGYISEQEFKDFILKEADLID